VRNCEGRYWKESWVTESHDHLACFAAIADEPLQILAIISHLSGTSNVLEPKLLACNELSDRISLTRQTIACWQARSREDCRSGEHDSNQMEHDLG
jgi:hypothetical protein